MIDLEEHNDARLDDVASQKCSTLMRYQKKYNDNQDDTWRTLPALIIQLDDNPDLALEWVVQMTYAYTSPRFFVRACPEFARHGVLESTEVDEETVYDTVHRLQHMMREKDPNGCLLVQPFVPATSSCVYAPGMYAVVSPDHDGTTAGTKGTTIYIPVHTSNHERWVIKGMELDELVDEDGNPQTVELEFVANLEENLSRKDMKFHTQAGSSEQVHNALVQIRGCDPHIPIVPTPDGVTIHGMVPCGRIEVKEVWVASGLESVPWLEENITKENSPEGFVISEPNGSLSSHICAHGRKVGVPYIVSDTVEVGDSWVEAASGWVINDPEGVFEPEPYDPTPYHEEFLRGVEYANKHWRHQHGWFSTFFHQWATNPHNHPAQDAYLGGVFTGWMLKACLGLCLGEMRHAIHNGRKKNLLPNVALFMQSIIGGVKYQTLRDSNNGPNIAGNRSAYYYMMEDTMVDWETIPLMFSILSKAFNTGWSSGYGGKKWGNAAKVGADTAKALLVMMEKPTKENTEEMIGMVNLLENVTHNNGFLYNKFLVKKAFDVGTGGFPSDNMSNIFYVYEMARDVLEGRLVTDSAPPPNDWRTIGKFFTKNHSAKYWRENPFFLNDDLPDVLLSEREHLRGRANQIHANSNHDYGDYYNTVSFIPCGDDVCTRCNTFYSNLQVKEDLPEEAIGDDGIPYDVWSAGINPNEQEELVNPDEHTSVLLDILTNIKPFSYHQSVSDEITHWQVVIEDGDDNVEVFKGHVMEITHHVLRWNHHMSNETGKVHDDEVMKLLVNQTNSMWSAMEDSSFVKAYHWIATEWEPNLKILLADPDLIPSHEYTVYDDDGFPVEEKLDMLPHFFHKIEWAEWITEINFDDDTDTQEGEGGFAGLGSLFDSQIVEFWKESE